MPWASFWILFLLNEIANDRFALDWAVLDIKMNARKKESFNSHFEKDFDNKI